MALLATEQQSGGHIVDVDGRQVVAVDNTALGGGGLTVTSTDPVSSTLAAGAGTLTAGATAALVAANASRAGLQVTVDTAATSPVYFRLGSSAASATAFSFALGAGGSWDGLIGNVLWQGAVQFFSAGTPKVGVVEV